MNDIDLDYDDDLEADAQLFGQQIAQGGAYEHQLSQLHLEPPDVLQAKTGSLEEALYVAREIYGETNSTHSEMFYQWVQTVLEGTTIDIRVAEEMLQLLHADKENFGGRLSWQQHAGKDAKLVRIRARRHASICAMNIVHAVLNKARGRQYMLWVDRALWRAVRAEKDVKSER